MELFQLYLRPGNCECFLCRALSTERLGGIDFEKVALRRLLGTSIQSQRLLYPPSRLRTAMLHLRPARGIRFNALLCMDL